MTRKYLTGMLKPNIKGSNRHVACERRYIWTSAKRTDFVEHVKRRVKRLSRGRNNKQYSREKFVEVKQTELLSTGGATSKQRNVTFNVHRQHLYH